MKNELAAIRRLVGEVTREQLRYVDCFAVDTIALFMPVGGSCFYALTPEHTHPAYSFILHFDDQTSVKMDTRVIPGAPGMFSALSPGIPHQELPSDVPPRYIAVMIDRNFFHQQYRLYSRRKPPVFRCSSFQPDRGLLQLLKRFMIESDSGIAGTDAILSALAVEICHSLIRSIVKAPAARDRMADRVEVGRAMEYIHSNLDAAITIEVLAAIARLSPSHFARVFRQEAGKPPMEYVQDLRLERAKKLLLAGDKSVSEIALDCGFNSPSYLSTCFHKAFNLTPSEYQRKAAGREGTNRRSKGRNRS